MSQERVPPQGKTKPPQGETARSTRGDGSAHKGKNFGKYYGDKVQSELVRNFAKYGLVMHKGENNNVQICGREDMFK